MSRPNGDTVDRRDEILLVVIALPIPLATMAAMPGL